MIIDSIRALCQDEDSSIVVTSLDSAKAIKALNTGKAADESGLSAEHIKYAPCTWSMIAEVMNEVTNSTQVPPNFKAGYKIPIPKKGKNPLICENNRGITITSIFGKTLEHIVLDKAKETFQKQDKPLQFGFTGDRAPSMASLCLTECIAEAKDTKSGLHIATLDACRAFDVVSHETLKRKLYSAGISGKLWCIIDDLHHEATERVKVVGDFSRQYTISQGVRQGGVLSTSLYKLYIGDLISRLDNAGLGARIGCSYIGAPTCADDVLLLSFNAPQFQPMLDISQEYSEQHQYKIHPQKSLGVQYIAPGGIHKWEDEGKCWKLGENPITTASEFTHLGLEWKAGCISPSVEAKIQLGRRAAYSMLGTGLHGTNGSDPQTSQCIIQTYIIPRILYGLDACIVSASDQKALDLAHRKLLREVQGLPDTTAIEAVYLLLGTVPISVELHIRTLCLIGSVARLGRDHPLVQTGIRQFATKPSSSHSWFIYAAKLGNQYDINMIDMFLYPWPKRVWNSFIRKRVLELYWDKLMTEAQTKSTLQNLDFGALLIGRPHPIWSTCGGKLHQVTASMWRARLLVGRYTLQATKAKYNQHKVNSTCPLCGYHTENLSHFLLHCPTLRDTREGIVRDISDGISAKGSITPSSDNEWCDFILNGGPLIIPKSPVKCSNTNDGFQTIYQAASHHVASSKCSSSNVDSKCTCIYDDTLIHQLCNLLCHRLHTRREIIINTLE